MKKIFLLFFMIIANKAFTQELFAFYDRYNLETQDNLKKLGYKNIYIITKGSIGDKAQIKIDGDKVIKFLKLNFNKKEEYYLVIDWEEGGYRDLRSYAETNLRFKNAEGEFLNLIKLIRRYNPNIKIGIYGIPFRVQVNKSSKLDGKKFLNLLKAVDFISPTLYAMSTQEEIGHKTTIKFFEENLKEPLLYSTKLNKPVYPFVWEIVHPNNPKSGNFLLSDREFFSDLSLIWSYQYANNKVKGFIFWAPKVSPAAYGVGNTSKSSEISNNNNNNNRSIYFNNRILNIKELLK